MDDRDTERHRGRYIAGDRARECEREAQNGSSHKEAEWASRVGSHQSQCDMTTPHQSQGTWRPARGVPVLHNREVLQPIHTEWGKTSSLFLRNYRSSSPPHASQQERRGPSASHTKHYNTGCFPYLNSRS